MAQGQIQPASLDLRLGRKAYRVRASFLPGRSRSGRRNCSPRSNTTRCRCKAMAPCWSAAASMSCRCWRAWRSPKISGAANPKSSTGRLDIFTRLITDRGERVRPGRARIQGTALRRGLAAQLFRAGARGLAAQSVALPRCMSRTSRNRRISSLPDAALGGFASANAARRWAAQSARRRRAARGARRRDDRRGIRPSRGLSRAKTRRRDRRRSSRRLSRSTTIGTVCRPARKNG